MRLKYRRCSADRPELASNLSISHNFDFYLRGDERVLLQRDVRSVQRWEKHEGLPVHRHSHSSRASVSMPTVQRLMPGWRLGDKNS